jgi:putative transposase
MFHFFRFCLGSISRCLHSRQSLLLENLALRQQLAVLTRRHPGPNLSPLDKLFWGLARLVRLEAGSPGGHSRDRGPLASHRLPPVLESDLQGETASRKQAAIQGSQGSDLSNGRGELELGRSSDSWRASHAGVRGLGTYYFALDETRTPRSRTRSAMAPLSSQSSRGHRRHGLFTVPTLTFGLLYGFFISSHDRRRIIHFNVTRHPTGSWIVQQLREAFPYQSAPRFLILDRDAKYGLEVPEALQSMSIAASKLPSEALGRTELRSAGWAVAGASCSTTSSP